MNQPGKGPFRAALAQIGHFLFIKKISKKSKG
jgi:hypothetical protein